MIIKNISLLNHEIIKPTRSLDCDVSRKGSMTAAEKTKHDSRRASMMTMMSSKKMLEKDSRKNSLAPAGATSRKGKNKPSSRRDNI